MRLTTPLLIALVSQLTTGCYKMGEFKPAGRRLEPAATHIIRVRRQHLVQMEAVGSTLRLRASERWLCRRLGHGTLHITEEAVGERTDAATPALFGLLAPAIGGAVVLYLLGEDGLESEERYDRVNAEENLNLSYGLMGLAGAMLVGGIVSAVLPSEKREERVSSAPDATDWTTEIHECGPLHPVQDQRVSVLARDDAGRTAEWTVPLHDGVARIDQRALGHWRRSCGTGVELRLQLGSGDVGPRPLGQPTLDLIGKPLVWAASPIRHTVRRTSGSTPSGAPEAVVKHVRACEEVSRRELAEKRAREAARRVAEKARLEAEARRVAKERQKQEIRELLERDPALGDGVLYGWAVAARWQGSRRRELFSGPIVALTRVRGWPVDYALEKQATTALSAQLQARFAGRSDIKVSAHAGSYAHVARMRRQFANAASKEGSPMRDLGPEAAPDCSRGLCAAAERIHRARPEKQPPPDLKAAASACYCFGGLPKAPQRLGCIGAIKLPLGVSEEDVLATMGPLRRRYDELDALRYSICASRSLSLAEKIMRVEAASGERGDLWEAAKRAAAQTEDRRKRLELAAAEAENRRWFEQGLASERAARARIAALRAKLPKAACGCGTVRNSAGKCEIPLQTLRRLKDCRNCVCLM